MTGRLFLLAGLCVLIGCAGPQLNKNYTKENLKGFTNLTVLEPVVRFTEISSDSQSRKKNVEDSAVATVKNDLAKFIRTSRSNYVEKINSDSVFSDSVMEFLSKGFASDDLREIKVPAFVKRRYKGKVIFNYIDGYYKTTGLIWKQSLKSIGIGIMTFGMFIPLYQSYSTNMYSMLIDTDKNEVIYFN